MSRLVMVWLGVCAGASASAGCIMYSPHSYVDVGRPFPGTHVELGGCLDVAVGIAEDTAAHGKVVEYSFGNRCRHRVDVDLASVRAVEYGADQTTRPLVAYDPRHEIVPLSIEALWMGDERIEYNALDARPGAPGSSICVDVGGLDRSGPRGERWVCVGAVVDASPPGGPS